MCCLRKVAWCCTCVLLAADATAQTPAIGVRPVHIGDQTVTGVVTPVPASANGYFVRVEAKTPAGSSATFVDQKPINTFDNGGGFSVSLTAPLGVGQTVTVAGGGATQTVSTEAAFQPGPQLRAALHDGMRVVPGHVENGVGVANVRVVVSRSNLESNAYTDYLQIKSTSDIDDDGNFSVTLPDPLVAGQVVRAQAFTATQESSLPSDGITVTDAGKLAAASRFPPRGRRVRAEGGRRKGRGRMEDAPVEQLLRHARDGVACRTGHDGRGRAGQRRARRAVRRLAQGRRHADRHLCADRRSANQLGLRRRGQPEIISYLHVTWGRAEAFAYRTNPADPSTVVSPMRTLVEGRLKIPDTALQIGFDGNLGKGHDDLRFIFGTRFDIGELFGKLRSFQ